MASNMIVIAGIAHAVQRPDTLDEQLLERTGCNAAEIADALGDFTTPIRAAIAVHPFLIEPRALHDLARDLESDMAKDRLAVIKAVRALFDAPVPAKPVKEPKHGA